MKTKGVLWLLVCALSACLPDPEVPRVKLPPPPDVQYFDRSISSYDCTELNSVFAGPPLPSISCEDLSAEGAIFTCRDAPTFVTSLYEGVGAHMCTMTCTDSHGVERVMNVRSVQKIGAIIRMFATELLPSSDGTLAYRPYEC